MKSWIFVDSLTNVTAALFICTAERLVTATICKRHTNISGFRIGKFTVYVHGGITGFTLKNSVTYRIRLCGFGLCQLRCSYTFPLDKAQHGHRP